MSDERKGWLGWMAGSEVEGPDGFVYHRRVESGPIPCKAPVWVTPLDPDGPKPGETWQSTAGDLCEILTPPFQQQGTRVYVRWLGGSHGAPLASILRPLPEEPEHKPRGGDRRSDGLPRRLAKGRLWNLLNDGDGERSGRERRTGRDRREP